MSAIPAKKWQQTQPQRKQERERQVKVKVHNKKWVTAGEKLLYTLFSGVIIAFSVFMVSFSSTTDSLNRDLQQLEQNVQKQQTYNENLKYKKKELSNPDRIIQIAKENGLKIQNSKVKQASKVTN